MISALKKRFQEQTLSAVDLYIKTLNAIDNKSGLNAFIYINKNGIKEAEKCQQNILNGTSRILEGIPIAVKDNFCTRNMPTTCASKTLQNFVPTYDAAVVDCLKSAGAVIVGKTNMDEFAMGSGTVDSAFGPTKNVWCSKPNKWHIAGGSSGGSCVAVASGMCEIALGSDTGGSIRNPASYCGIVGYKPSYGLISRHGLIPLVNSMDCPGIIAKTVDDIFKILSVIVRAKAYDSTCIDVCLDTDEFYNTTLIENYRIAIPEEYNCDSLSEEVKDTWNYVASVIDNSKAIVQKVSMPHTSASVATYSVLNACEVASNMARYTGLLYGYRSSCEHETFQSLIATNRFDSLGEVVRSRILSGNYFLLKRNYEKYYEQSLKVRRLIANDFNKVWQNGYNFLVTPTTLTTAPLLKDFKSLDNRTQCATQDYCTQPANMSGCPAITIPVKLSSDQMPISIQIMAPNFSDVRLLQFANWLEAKLQFSQKQ
ncbi:glutamyl-tRNA(Gln) amidotransferase subunit A, mitochondrial isoform X2 [Adelges cooleyi]|uniref:glutamyl-tRNA(Gln) amidotransferase subunit A, mitochondrial isoform X2 n=1 Tax=Adelges cooleyi TaxID=133065 RepID=UPI00218023FB|nr:glutamyl-tRNA(Gln) amidotransferase subunit A, mitochondrial isoform X2 [Adelges cooleyi]